jgi:endonuclease/exonuclease/phosphatase family metal-dependent hydrolase
MRVGLLSKYPISQTNWIFQGEMERPILLARIDVPDVVRDPWVAVVHLKCCNTNPWNQYTRAAELYYLRKEIDQQTGTNDPVMIMGDFNLVAPSDVTYETGPEGVSPFPAPASADGYFVPQGIFKLDARHAGAGGEHWTWRSNGEFPNGALDHIMVNAVVRARGTAVEIYNAQKDAMGIAGLPKQGAPLAGSFAYISDHLPVFADINLEDSNTAPGNLVITATPGLVAEGNLGGPFAPNTGTYLLSNTGLQPLEWGAEHDAPWVSLSSPGGVLAPGESIEITAQLTTSAASLPAGMHRVPLRFVNRTNGFGTAVAEASVFAGAFVMDGSADSPGYVVDGTGITLHVAMRGTRLYVATRSSAYQPTGSDHHIFIANTLLLPSATAPAPWAKRGLTALPEGSPYLAAEGANDYAGWFNAANPTRLAKSPTNAGVLEGSIDLLEQFGAVPEFVYIAAVAYETSDASVVSTSFGRVVSQAPAAVVADDMIGPEEFLRIPLRSVADSAADGRYDTLVPGRGFSANVVPPGGGAAAKVQWKSVPGHTYRVLRKSEFTEPTWQIIGTIAATRDSWETTFEDTASGKRSFYKVEVLSPGN